MEIPMNISREIFRAYDIRGIAHEDLNADVVYAIGLAFATKALECGCFSAVIARDGRLSGPELLEALEAGLTAGGLCVINIGAVPTPLLYFATHHTGTQTGLMLTGSHNPKDYNGIKMVLNGETLATHQITDLYDRIVRGNFNEGAGESEARDITADYISTIVNGITLDKPLKIVVDSGNGITGNIAPTLFRALGCEVHELYCEVDGAFPNHHPDPSKPANLACLQERVKALSADIGLAFDGDGDRLGVITNQGTIIWPDRVLMLFAESVLKQQTGKVIFDVKCTKFLPEIIAQHHGEPIMWKTGHSFIKSKIRETQALLAGEMSGHFFFNDKWYGFDDGLYAGCRLLEILSKQEDDIETLFNRFPNCVNTPEIEVPVPEDIKFAVVESIVKGIRSENARITTIDGLRLDFDDAWGLIRPSNTTPNLILRFEANNESRLSDVVSVFEKLLHSVVPELALPKQLTNWISAQ